MRDIQGSFLKHKDEELFEFCNWWHISKWQGYEREMEQRIRGITILVMISNFIEPFVFCLRFLILYQVQLDLVATLILCQKLYLSLFLLYACILHCRSFSLFGIILLSDLLCFEHMDANTYFRYEYLNRIFLVLDLDYI